MLCPDDLDDIQQAGSMTMRCGKASVVTCFDQSVCHCAYSY